MGSKSNGPAPSDPNTFGGQSSPAPPPRKGPTIIVKGSHPPPHVLAGADMMADDRVCDIDRASGRVKVYRRADTWRPVNGTDKFLLALVNEIRRLRVEAGLPEFDN